MNGRFFRSAYLHKAVMKAYEDMIADGALPSYVIFLEAAPSTVDVNIHPAKTEIKFQDDAVIFQILYACVKEALGKNSFGASIDFEGAAQGAADLPVFGSKYERLRDDVFAPEVSVDQVFNPFNTFPSYQQSYQKPYSGGGLEPKQDYSKLFEEEQPRPASKTLILFGKYIVSRSSGGLTVINVRRARERVLYEKFLKALSSGGHVTQAALFPVQVRVGMDNMQVITDNSALLKGCGFDIEPLGTDTIVVNGVPEGYSCDPQKVEAMVSDIILILSEGVSSLPGVMEAAMAERFARLGAAEGDLLRSDFEAASLAESLFACENAEYTSSGKKIITVLDENQLEKLF